MQFRETAISFVCVIVTFFSLSFIHTQFTTSLVFEEWSKQQGLTAYAY